MSQGAQQHYFPTKAELALAAFARWFEKTATAGLIAGPVGGNERERLENLLDRLWEIHRPVVAPTLDFLGAERNNPDVASGVAASFNTLAHLAHAVTAAAVPETARIADFDQWLNTVLATIRGAVVFADVTGIELVLIDWPTLRVQLLRNLDAAVTQAGSAAIPDA